MKVSPHDHALRFRVTSDSQTDVEHVVDLAAFNGRGRCSCQHFEFRIMPELEAGNPAPLCKHVMAARDFLTDEVIARMIANQNPGPDE